MNRRKMLTVAAAVVVLLGTAAVVLVWNAGGKAGGRNDARIVVVSNAPVEAVADVEIETEKTYGAIVVEDDVPAVPLQADPPDNAPIQSSAETAPPRAALAPEEKSPVPVNESRDRFLKEEKLARDLGLKPARTTAATKLMKKYTVEELDLLARVQRATQGDVPQAVIGILEMHRQRAGYEDLLQETDKALAGNLTARLAVRAWLRKRYEKPAERVTAPARVNESIRIGRRLRKATGTTQERQDDGDERQDTSETF